jgi:uncharacterized repeat protein (TIGR02543 family)
LAFVNYAIDNTASDMVTSYSNTYADLNLLAPSNQAYTTDIVGSGGYSTGDYYPSFGGTSAACPYAAGASACLQCANKALVGTFLTPDQVRATLIDTGDAITDGKIAITKPRVNLGAAVDTIASGMKVSPSDDLLSEGNSGGPFNPASIVYTLENQTNTAINYTVSKGASWVSISDTGGSLAGHATTDVIISINSNANSLSNGIYTDRISFINTTDNHGDTTRDVTLTVGAATLQYSWNMDANPGWTTEGLWAWGQPTGAGGQYGGKDPTSGYTGTNVYGYNLFGDYENNLSETHLTTPAINCTELENVSLRFRRWLGVEQPAYDHAYVRVSTNGTTWATVWQNTAEVTDSSWVLQDFDISIVADGQPTVYLQWTMGATDGSWQYCGWNIDDVEIWGVRATATAGTPSSITVPTTDTDGNYVVSWGASSTSNVTYILEEASDASFGSGLRIAYSGSSTSATITGRASGSTYYYRIKATRTGYNDSGWRIGSNGCAILIEVGLTIAVFPAGSGTTTPPAGSTTDVDVDVPQHITATANGVCRFVKWTADPTGNATFEDASDATTTVLLTGSATVTANFAINTYILTTTANPAAGGTVTKNPSQGTYDHGTDVQLTADASAGYTFTGWTGDLAGMDNPANLTMDGDKNVTANFAPIFTVTYNGNGNTGGTPPVDGNAYQQGDHVTVLGNTGGLVKTGYTFNNWNTAADGGGNPYSPGDSFKMPGANVTVYAQWSSASTRYVCSDAICGNKTPCHKTISGAVQDAATGTLILIAAEEQNGGFSLNADKDLTLQGGWDKTFNDPNGGTTTLHGAPKAPQGSLTFQNLSIVP